MKYLLVIILALMVSGCTFEDKKKDYSTELQDITKHLSALEVQVEQLTYTTRESGKRAAEVYLGVATLCDILKGSLALQKLKTEM